MDKLLPDETLEDLGRGGFSLIQKKNHFRFGEDTVLLSYFVAAHMGGKKSQRGLELGAGCGAASVLLAARRPDIRIDAVEIDPVTEAVFQKNIIRNQLQDRVSSFCVDLRQWPMKEQKGIQYDFAFFNPPYRVAGRGKETAKEKESALLSARFEIFGGLNEFIFTAAKHIKSKGCIYFVQRAGRFDESVRLLSAHAIQPEKVWFVHPSRDKDASLFLMIGKKGGNAGGFRVLPPLILYNEDRSTSQALKKIYGE